MTWQMENKQFGIVLDNKYMYVHVKPGNNTMFHTVQAIAIEERIQSGRDDQIPPSIRIDEVAPEHVLPSDRH